MSRLAFQRDTGARCNALLSRKRYFAGILWLFMVVLPVHAQDATATPFAPPINADQSDIVNAYFRAANTAPLVGEMIEVALIIEVPPGVQLANFPEFPTDEIFVVLEKSGVTTETRSDGTTIYTQILKMILWLPGQHLTPEIPVTFNYNGVVMSNPVKSMFFTVPSVIETSPDRTLRPDAPSVEMPYVSPWLLMPVVLGIGTGVYGFRRLLRRRTGRIAGIMGGTPTQIAIAELEDLKTQSLPAATVYLLVADKLRGYLQVVYQINAIEMTTAELNTLLTQGEQLPDNLRKGLRQVLEQADLVKFARFEPEMDTAIRLVNYAIRWLQAIEKAHV